MCDHDHHHDTRQYRETARGSAASTPTTSLVPPTKSVPAVTRRTVLAAGASAVAFSVAGCLGDSGAGPAPVAVTESMQCDVCGMVISKHPGPNGQLFFRDEGPEGHDPPARFDSLKQCLFPYLLEREQLGWDPTGIYVTDYSSVDYSVSSAGGKRFVSSHIAADSFADGRDLYFVVGSDVEGAMGPDFVPFSVEGDATTFADEYGGQVLTYDEIDEGVIGQ